MKENNLLSTLNEATNRFGQSSNCSISTFVLTFFFAFFFFRKLTLAGVGVRIKTIGPIKAKVYSAGIYVDKGKIVSQCKVLKCTTEKELINSTEFENTVSDFFYRLFFC